MKGLKNALLYFLTRSLLIVLLFSISLSNLLGGNKKLVNDKDSMKEVEKKSKESEGSRTEDPNVMFNTVWKELVTEYGGEENLKFPKEIFWLNGAPGAGKGTHTEFIKKHTGLTVGPVIISDLVQSPEALKQKNAGLLVDDREVTTMLLKKLLEPQYANGVIVDGYPRTQRQAECLKLFYNKLTKLNSEYKANFHVIVLFVEEEESVKRQLERGRKALAYNQEVEAKGVGRKEEVRVTDLDTAKAQKRYRTFMEQTHHSLQSLKGVFPYHFIDAHGTIEDVQKRIIKELKH